MTDSGKWRTTNNSFDLQREAYSLYRYNSGKPISTISWLAYRCQLFAAGAPLNWINHIFWLQPRKPFFLRFREKVLFKLKNKISAVQCKRKTFRLIPLSTPVDFRWTMPLRTTIFGRNLVSTAYDI